MPERMSEELVRAPKQERSRQSFDRAVDAAVDLLVERRSGAFTVADVARVSGVSTGSIYGRVASKDDLMRVAHAREMDRLEREATAAFARVPGADAPLAAVVSHVVRALAELLARNARVLAPFMLVGHADPVISDRGSAAHAHMLDAVVALLLPPVRGEGRARADEAVRWAATVAYSVLARQLGLGNDPGSAADYSLDAVVEELAVMLAAYLGPDAR